MDEQIKNSGDRGDGGDVEGEHCSNVTYLSKFGCDWKWP